MYAELKGVQPSHTQQRVISYGLHYGGSEERNLELAEICRSFGVNSSLVLSR